MSERTTERSQSDQPENWGRYHTALQQYGMGNRAAGSIDDLNRRILLDFDQRLEDRRDRRIRNWAVGLPVSIAAFCCSLFFILHSFDGTAKNGTQIVITPPASITTAPQADVMERPEIPPVWFDSSLPTLESQNLPFLLDSTLLDIQNHPSEPVDSPVAGASVK